MQLSFCDSSNVKDLSLSTDLHTVFFTVKCNLLIPLAVNSHVCQGISISPCIYSKAFAKDL